MAEFGSAVESIGFALPPLEGAHAVPGPGRARAVVESMVEAVLPVSEGETLGERRRTFLLVRYVLIITVGALAVLHARGALPAAQAVLIVGALASNVVLGRAAEPYFFRWWVQGPMLLADTVWIGVILLSAGVGQQFFLFYFIELFLCAISESLMLLAVGAMLIGVANLLLGGHGAMSAASLIRLPFFFATAIFYGHVVDTTKHERRVATQRAEWASRLEVEVQARTEELQRQSSELRALYRRVLEADRLKSEFIANMSHELRSPLDVIMGYTDLALADTQLPAGAEARTFVEHIAAGTRTLHRLVESVLHYATLDRGLATLVVTTFPADKLLAELRDLCGDVRHTAALRVHVPAAPGLELRTDFDRLHSVLSHLLLNAIKFTHRGTVELSVAVRGGAVEFGVRDTGAGIPAPALEGIFEPFRQVDGAAPRTGGGAGLGLAIVRRNITLLRGRIDVDSQVGVGSTFRVTIPHQLDPDGTDD